MEQFKNGFIEDLTTFGGYTEELVDQFKTKQVEKEGAAELKALQAIGKMVDFVPAEKENQPALASQPSVSKDQNEGIKKLLVGKLAALQRKQTSTSELPVDLGSQVWESISTGSISVTELFTQKLNNLSPPA